MASVGNPGGGKRAGEVVHLALGALSPPSFLMFRDGGCAPLINAGIVIVPPANQTLAGALSGEVMLGAPPVAAFAPRLGHEAPHRVPLRSRRV